MKWTAFNVSACYCVCCAQFSLLLTTTFHNVVFVIPLKFLITHLAIPNLMLCFPTGNAVNVVLLPSRERGDVIFTPVVLSSSYEIFGLSAALQSVSEDTTDAIWACSIFLIGSNNEIVATTRPVRYCMLYSANLSLHTLVVHVFPVIPHMQP